MYNVIAFFLKQNPRTIIHWKENSNHINVMHGCTTGRFSFCCEQERRAPHALEADTEQAEKKTELRIMCYTGKTAEKV